MDDSRTGVLVIRIWNDRGASAPVKARVTGTLDLRSQDRTEVTCAGVEEVRSVVDGWLTEFTGREAAPAEHPPPR